MKRLPKTLSVHALREAWKDSRDSKSELVAGAPGVDRVRPAVFASELPRHIVDIRKAIGNETFRFDRLRFAPVPKPSGGHRIIAIPTVRDRLIQRALRRDLESDARFQPSSPIAYGFTKGRTLADAQRRALALRNERPWVLQADIIKFFDQILRSEMKRLVRSRVRRLAIARLLCLAVECELEDVSGKGGELVRECGIKRGVGLRQGMPVSPMLSNLFLKGFDNTLTKRHLVAIRYADDIAVFGSSKNEMLSALSVIKNTLAELELTIPELEDGGKTVIRGPSEAVEFLGVELRRSGDVYKLAVPKKKLEKIEADMAEMAAMSACIKDKRTLGQVVRSLDAFIVGHRAAMAVLDNPAEFFNRLEAAKERKLNTLLVEVLGAPVVENLDSDRRAILGLQRFD